MTIGDASMRASRYNYFFKLESGFHAGFNGVKQKFLRFNEDQYEIVRKIIADPEGYQYATEAEKELKDSLSKTGFLIEDDLDELNLIRVKSTIDRFNAVRLRLTIAPTMNCNFRCIYCYESHKNEVMDDKVANSLVEYVSRKSRTIRTLWVKWFGGEPLLKFDLMRELSKEFSEICEKNRIRFIATVLTNGYLLDAEVFSILVEELSVKFIQVTMDGPREIHDRRRPLANGRGTFDKIMDNLREISRLKYNLPITIRVNVDKDNKEKALDILDVLEENDLKDKVSIYFAPVAPFTQFCPSLVRETFMPLSDFYRHEGFGTRFAETVERGFRLAQPPDIKGGWCSAIRFNSYIVVPGGDLYKCDNEIGVPGASVGHIDEKGRLELKSNLLKWFSWAPWEQERCRECAFLPICMGGCLYRRMKQIDEKGDDTPRCPELSHAVSKIRYLQHLAELEGTL